MVFLYRLEKASGRVHALALLCAARSALHLLAEEARHGLRELALRLAGGAVAVNTLPNVLLVELGLTEDDVDDISGFSREIAGVEIGVMLREGPDGGKISLRCSPKYDAAAICARLGGGGHRGAAGASVPEGLDAAKKAILQAIADSGVEL